MKLNNLLCNVDIIQLINFSNFDVTSIVDNSKNANNGSLFFCINGFSLDGSNFALEAVKNGAKAIVTQNVLDVNCTQIVVDDVRKTMSIIASNFYYNAHKHLKIVGVVGTNGKSSSSYILKSCLDKLHIKTALIGTNEIIYDNKKFESVLTTPDPIQLHKLFYDFWKSGVEAVVMEVSAHSIFLNKIYGINFFTIALTNVKTDHLDFFKTQQSYENTKKRIFLENQNSNLVVNLDDKVGKALYEKIKCYTFSTKTNATIIGKTHKNSIVEIVYNKQKFFYVNNLMGKFNVYNQLLAITVLINFGFEIKDILNAISDVKSISGRCNIFQTQKSIVVVDYAHSASSLQEFLKAVKTKFNKPLIAVVGCPGNRDEYKRKEFGKILNKYCEYVFLSQDNPKYENPFRIMRQMSKALTIGKYVMVQDRKKAIQIAYKMAKKLKFVLVIIGKGMEEYQDINGKKIRHSDINCVKNLLHI